MALTILILCNLPKSAAGNAADFFFPGFDKLVHLAMFFKFNSLLILGEIYRQKNFELKASTLFQLFLLSLFYGAFIEFLQDQVFTYRAAEYWDWIADAAGALLSLAFYVALLGLKRKV